MKLIAAIAPKAGYAIGNNGNLPWRCASDLQHFSRVTAGGTLIMGRKTFESLPGTLHGRNIVVMSRSAEKIEGANVARDMQHAITAAVSLSRCYSKIFVAGGAEKLLAGNAHLCDYRPLR